MSSAEDRPIASAALKPNIFSAPGFQLKNLPSVATDTMASADAVTIAAS